MIHTVHDGEVYRPMPMIALSQCIASLDMQGSYIVVIATQLVLPFEMTSIYLYWIVCSKNLNEDGVCMLMKTEATARL